MGKSKRQKFIDGHIRLEKSFRDLSEDVKYHLD